MTESELIQKVWQLCQSILGDDCSLFLLGSRAEKLNSEYSDFDFYVSCNQPIDPNKWLTFQDAVEELTTLYKIDLIEFEKTGDHFKRIASKSAKEVINGQIRR